MAVTERSKSKFPSVTDSYPFIANPLEVVSIHFLHCLTSRSFLSLPSTPTDADNDPLVKKSKASLLFLLSL